MKWVKIKDHPYFWASENGDIISLRSKNSRILKPGLCTKGYFQIEDGCRTKGTRKHLAVHRLIAIAFIPNPNNLPQVNHIDGNKINNKIINLEWCTASENIKHAFKQNLIISPNKGKFGKDNHLSKPINQFTLKGEFIKKWECGYLIKKAGFNNVTSCCQGKIKSDKGFIWKYA